MRPCRTNPVGWPTKEVPHFILKVMGLALIHAVCYEEPLGSSKSERIAANSCDLLRFSGKAGMPFLGLSEGSRLENRQELLFS